MPSKTTRHNQLFATLQFADSFFPSGATSMSNGLEALVHDNLISAPGEVEAFLISQLQYRWANFDRPIVIAASREAGDLDKVANIDLQVNAQYLCAEARTSSIQTGNALLGVHVQLGSNQALAFKQMIFNESAVGHSCVVQGFVWSQSGIEISSMEIMSAHGCSVGIVGAALRLGIIGHIDAQKILGNTHRVVARIVSKPPVDLDSIFAFTPQQEISMMRHETMSHRLFIN